MRSTSSPGPQALGGHLPHRVVRGEGLTGLPQPVPVAFAEFGLGSRGQEVSTTMAFARLLRNLLRDPGIGKYVVPIIPDEGRTFGLDALFSEVKIYAPERSALHLGGRRTAACNTPRAARARSSKRASPRRARWRASRRRDRVCDLVAPMLPFYLYYSMFGFQRIGDLIWQAADARARGFLLGCTAGRTTMNGEGLQHEDGQSLLLASVVPECRAPTTRPSPTRWRPSSSTESSDMYGPKARGLSSTTSPSTTRTTRCPRFRRRGREAGQGGHSGASTASPRPAPVGSRDHASTRQATILFSGPAWQAAMQAREMLASEWDVSAEAWSVTSYKALREDGLEVERWNRLHPGSAPRCPT